MNKSCHFLLNKLFTIVAIVLLTVFISSPVSASVSGGVGKVVLSPVNTTIPIGTPTSVDILFNTANVAVSGIQVVATFPVSDPTDLSATVTQNDALGSGWAFALSKISVTGGVAKLEIMALNLSTAGYSNNTNTKLATITFNAYKPFTGKAFTFDTSFTKMMKKADSSDILGTPTNGSYSTSGAAITTTPTLTTLTTATPTPTGATSGGGSPVCNSLYTDISSHVGVPVNITLTCSGTDTGGTIKAAEFVFGDGSSQVVEKDAGSPGSISVTHQYKTVGSVGASCRVRDNDSNWSSTPDGCKKIVVLKPGSSTPTPTRAGTVIRATATPLPTATPVVIIDTVSPTPSPEITIEDTITPEPTLYPEEDPGTTQSNGTSPMLWIGLGAIVLVIIAFLFLKRRTPNQPPMAPPGQNPYYPQQPAQPPMQPQQPMQQQPYQQPQQPVQQQTYQQPQQPTNPPTA